MTCAIHPPEHGTPPVNEPDTVSILRGAIDRELDRFREIAEESDRIIAKVYKKQAGAP